MEALGELEHRTDSEALTGWNGWVSLLCKVKPHIRPYRSGIRDGRPRTLLSLTPRDLGGSPRKWSRIHEGNDVRPRPGEESDYFTVAQKFSERRTERRK